MRRMTMFLALAVIAGPAHADNQDKKENAAAVAAIKARIEQLKQSPGESGCLGKDAVTCLATLSGSVYISTEPLWLGGGLKLPKPVERDINGQPMSQIITFLVTFNPRDRAYNGPTVVHASLYLGDGEHIARIDYSLGQSTFRAQTPAEWDATHVFELATATLGSACLGSDRLAFYRQYDRAQRQWSSGDEAGGSYSDPRIFSGIVGNTEICGVDMTTTTVSGFSASVGSYGGSSLSFSTKRDAKKNP
jgi:hypothetical protein